MRAEAVVSRSRVAVTGATGYIGRILVDVLQDAGFSVLALSRRPVPGIEWRYYDLGATATDMLALPEDVGALVHLAAETGPDADPEREATAVRMLTEALTPIGARLVLVSSQTAAPDASTGYGHAKWAAEQVTLAAGGVAIRLGLVYGGTPRGLYGTLLGAVARLPLLPAFRPGGWIHPVHVDDVAAAILMTLALDRRARVLSFGDPARIRFDEFLAELAWAQRQRRLPRCLIPSAPLLLLYRVLLRLGWAVPVLARVVSLLRLPPTDSAPDLQELGLTLQPLAVGLREGVAARRLAVLEARRLFMHVFDRTPPLSLIRRYLRLYPPTPALRTRIL